MIVADASAVVLALTDRSARGRAARDRLAREPSRSPQLLVIEVVHVFRRLVRSHTLDPGRAAHAILDLTRSPIQLQDHRVLAARVWELRDNLSAHDAVYVALAEALDCPLVTADRRIATAPGHRVEVDLLA